MPDSASESFPPPLSACEDHGRRLGRLEQRMSAIDQKLADAFERGAEDRREMKQDIKALLASDNQRRGGGASIVQLVAAIGSLMAVVAVVYEMTTRK